MHGSCMSSHAHTLISSTGTCAPALICLQTCTCVHTHVCTQAHAHGAFLSSPFVSPFHLRPGSTRLCLFLTGRCFLPIFQTENRAVSCCCVFPRFCRDIKVGIPGETTCPIPIPIPRPCLLLSGCWHQHWGLNTGPVSQHVAGDEHLATEFAAGRRRERRGAGMELEVPLNSPEGVKAG